jgi:hypothetical protein
MNEPIKKSYDPAQDVVVQPPEIVKTYFGMLYPPKDMLAGCVYFGADTLKKYESLTAWPSRSRSSGPTNFSIRGELFQIFVSATEVIEQILADNDSKVLTDEVKKEIKEYLDLTGLTLNKTSVQSVEKEEVPEEKPLTVEKPKKPRKSRRILKVEKPVEKLFEGKILRTVKFILEEPIKVSSYLGNEQVEVEPGEIVLAEIESPLKLEYMDSNDKKKNTWWVLENQLPKIFGRSVVNWYQLFGYDPFVIPSEDNSLNNPPAE